MRSFQKDKSLSHLGLFVRQLRKGQLFPLSLLSQDPLKYANGSLGDDENPTTKGQISSPSPTKKMLFSLRRLFRYFRYKSVCVRLVSFCDNGIRSETRFLDRNVIFGIVFLLILILGFLRAKLADLPFLLETPQCVACMKDAPFKSWPKGACSRYYCYECPEELISSTSDGISQEPPRVENNKRPLLLAWKIESEDILAEIEGNPVKQENTADSSSPRVTPRGNIQKNSANMCGHEVCPGCQQKAHQDGHVNETVQNSKWEKPRKDCTQCGSPVSRCKNTR